MAISLSGFYENIAQGWKRSVSNGQREADIETGLVRGKLRAVPWEGADFTLTGLYSWRQDNSTYKPVSWRGNHDLAGLPGIQVPVKPWTYSTDYGDTSHNTHLVNVSLRGDIEVGPGTLTTTTAYARSYSALQFDPDNLANGSTYATTDTDYKSFTQELLYATEKLGRFQMTGGLFFFNSNSVMEPYFVESSGFQLWYKDNARSWTAFGEMTYDLTDRLTVSAGLRYSYEKRSSRVAMIFGPKPFSAPPLSPLGQNSWDALTPRISILYEVTPTTNIYATFSQGFKSGIFNTPGLQRAPVDQEEITAYEIGLKMDLGSKLRFNAAGFHYDYKDLQIPSVQLTNNVLSQCILNAASAKIWGAEANLSAELIRDFTLTAGVSYLDAQYQSFPNVSVNAPVSQLPALGNSVCTEPVRPTSGLCNLIINASGNAMIRAPKWSGSITALYSHEFPTGTLNLSATAYLSSEIYYEFANRIRQPGYGKINATGSWEFNNGLRFAL